ncbi:hypothetical protein I4U23_014817 [Adineta vaga]|nr:hypothetical protein I4U23_014817 [Adineta vaga]
MHYESYQMSTTITSRRNQHGAGGGIDGYTAQDHIDASNAQLNSTRAQRIRAAIFPEIADDNSSNNVPCSPISPTQFRTGQATAVQKLSEPSQLLKNAVNDIINYKEDAEITEKALPELIRLLNDNDPLIAGQAALVLHTLARKEASRIVLSSSHIVQALIQAISNPRATDETRRDVAGVLYCLSQYKQGLLMIFKAGGIPVLVKLLDSCNEFVVNHALSTLHNLLLYIEQAKCEVICCGGGQKMICLLNNPNPKFLAILIDCLYMLAFHNEDMKLLIESSNGSQQLLRILDMTNYEKLAWTTTRLLRVLSASPTIKTNMVVKNTVQILEKQLYQPISLRVQQNCLLILRNLSDQAVQLENLDSLIRLLIDLLRSSDFITVTCSAGILSNLTCNHQYNKAFVVQSDGVHALINTLLQGHNKEELIEPTICTLRHVTNRHSHANEAQNIIRSMHGYVPIIDLLNPTLYSWPIIKSTISLIRNLGLSKENLPALREANAVEKLVQILIQSYDQLEHQTAHKQFNDNCIPMNDIIEGSICALHVLAKDPQSRQMIRNLDSIPLFVQCLRAPTNIPIQRATTGVLCELVNDRTCVECIEQQNCTQILTDLLKSNDEGVATCAAAILFRLSDDKPCNDGVTTFYREEHGVKNHYQPKPDPYARSFRRTPPPMHDAPIISYYTSESSPVSGLIDNPNCQGGGGAWLDSDL